ncbi:Demethylrebeccamycin-D-glucose O-methyltransferase [Aliiroseovarius pelagivivens]|uniref:Demethylrebeccamycin-D-glucose O-methyltransferase n=1 Tax=Aliiroseovarius pelagivivens TaxID=1639690 RepID=A0A2R8AS10_9RHOB|nr:methyltransferase domain-containing protein [Aliiroseovarius pelagivivens]SPF78853.1 Demethylrebeccamycin-D-glucose O-methyltransferase [Aliiroseovarius pelagivivens]
MELNAVKTSYARWAPVYDKTFGAITNVGRRTAVDYINEQGAEKVLEVGVGTGLALPNYRSDLRVTGIDFSEDMLAKARAKAKTLDLNHVQDLRQMDARNLDFPDALFDVVAAMHIISVVPEPERVMAEMVRVCKPGGRLVITNHFARETGLLARIERLTAPFANLLGWHSDFEITTVLKQPELKVIEKKSLPPMGMMTFLVLQKSE